MSDDLSYDDDGTEDADETASLPDNQRAAATRVQRKLEKQLADTRLELAITQAGIPGLNAAQQRALASELQGKESTAEAVKAAAQELGYLASPQVEAELNAHDAQSRMTATPSAPPPPATPAAALAQLAKDMANAPPGAFRDSAGDPALRAAARKAIEDAGLEWDDTVQREGGFVPI